VNLVVKFILSALLAPQEDELAPVSLNYLKIFIQWKKLLASAANCPENVLKVVSFLTADELQRKLTWSRSVIVVLLTSFSVTDCETFHIRSHNFRLFRSL